MLVEKNIIDIIEIRLLMPGDDLNELTSLLNRSYKKLADMGFKYQATFQNALITKKRIEKASCFVVLNEKKLIGTISYYSPLNTSGNEWYDLDYVAHFGQFAVDPVFQGLGIGRILIKKMEELAFQDNASELALDTSEGAKHLIDFYGNLGYRHVAYTQWGEANYRSVIMSKKINSQIEYNN